MMLAYLHGHRFAASPLPIVIDQACELERTECLGVIPMQVADCYEPLRSWHHRRQWPRVGL